MGIERQSRRAFLAAASAGGLLALGVGRSAARGPGEESGRIYFGCGRQVEASGNLMEGLFALNLAEGTSTKVADTYTLNDRISPDGRWLVQGLYGSREARGVFVRDIRDGGEPKQLCEGYGFSCWHPDSRHLTLSVAIQDGDELKTQVLRFDVETWTKSDLHHFANEGVIDILDDGRILTNRRAGERSTELLLRGPDGAELRTLVRGERILKAAFTPDGKGASYARLDPGKIVAWRVPLDGGEPDRLLERIDEPIGIGSPCWSPDGKRLAMSVAEVIDEGGEKRAGPSHLETAAPDGSDRKRLDLALFTNPHLIDWRAS